MESSNPKIEFAAEEKVTRYSVEVQQILQWIGEFMDPDDPIGWTHSCWVSDRSTLSDFRPDEDEQAVFEAHLGFKVDPQAYIGDLAEEMNQRGRLNV